MQNKNKSILNVLIIISAIIALDQWSKAYVVKLLQEQSTIIHINQFLNIVLAYNFGIAFGIFNDAKHSYMVPIIVGMITITILWWWVLKNKVQHYQYALSFITGGAIANIIDRLIYGAVVDFIDFHALGYHYPAFNLADSFILIGAGILMFAKDLKS